MSYGRRPGAMDSKAPSAIGAQLEERSDQAASGHAHSGEKPEEPDGLTPAEKRL